MNQSLTRRVFLSQSRVVLFLLGWVATTALHFPQASALPPMLTKPAPANPPAGADAPTATSVAPPSVTPAGSSGGWQARIDAGPATEPVKTDLNLLVPSKHGLKVAGPDRPAPFLAIADFDWTTGDEAWSLLDLRKGAFTAALKGKLALEDPIVSADGQYLAGKSKRKPDNADVLDVWAFKTAKLVARLDKPEKIWNFEPIGVAGERLVAFTSSGFDKGMVAYDLKSGTKAWEARLANGCEPYRVAISPGGAYVATVTDADVSLFSATDGSPVGSAPIPLRDGQKDSLDVKAVAFSADGKELAALTHLNFNGERSRILVWDAATGRVTADVLGEAVKDERWTKKGRKFEYLPGGVGWRFDRSIIDRASGKVIATVGGAGEGPQGHRSHHANMHGNEEYLAMLDANHAVTVSERDADQVRVAAVALPRDQMEKSAATVRAGGRASDADLPPLAKADATAARALQVVASESAWTLKPEGEAPGGRPAAAALPLRRSAVHGAAQGWTATGIVFGGAPARQVAVSYKPDAGNKAADESVATTVDRLSATGGSTVGTATFPGQAIALDLSGDGKLLLLRTDAGNDIGRVDFYSVAEARPRQVVSFRPYDAEPNETDRGVIWGAIVDESHLLTCSKRGKLALWVVATNPASVKADYVMELGGSGYASERALHLSPRRTQLAAGCPGGVAILDPRSGTVLAFLPHPGNDPFATQGTLAFHAGGDKLALVGGDSYPSVTVWNLSDGKATECAYSATRPETGRGAQWCGPSYLMAGHSTLLSLDLRTPVWRYQPDVMAPEPTGQLDDDRYWAVVSGGPNQALLLRGFDLPHDEARKRVAGLKPDEMLVVRPGAAVTLDVRINGDEAAQKAVRAALSQKLADAGLKEADGQSVRLEATVTQSGSYEQQYQRFGGQGPANERVSVPSYLCKVALVAGGSEVWSVKTTTGSGAPSMLHLAANQTVQDYINKLNANPGVYFFQRCGVPGVVAKPLENLGTSRLTPTGPVAAVDSPNAPTPQPTVPRPRRR